MNANTKYWQDFKTGDCYQYGSYKVTEEEVIEFGLKYDPLPHHIGVEQAKNTTLGVLCASGIHILGMAQKLLCDNLYNNSSLIAGKGVESMRVLKPVVPGDILSVSLNVHSASLHPYKSDRGWVDLRASVTRQGGEEVMTFRNDILFLCR